MFAVMRRDGIPIPVDPKTKKFSCATKLTKGMIATYPLLGEFYEDKRMIDTVKNLKLEIGADGRNRFWLNPFGTKTGRNNPSTNRCVLGLPHPMRSYIKPPPGMALAQVDVGAEEFGIAAALSGDSVLRADYESGDPYRQFAAARSASSSRPNNSGRSTRPRCWAESTAWASPRWPAISESPTLPPPPKTLWQWLRSTG
jgi:DNA polymerase I